MSDSQFSETGPGGGISFRQPVTPPVPASDPTNGLQSIMDALPPAIGTLTAIVKQGVPSGAFDSAKSLTEYMQALEEAQKKAPSVYELQAQNALEESKAAQGIADYEKNNPLAPPRLLTAPQYAPLQLPGVPNNVQSHPNGIASLGAGIAGLVAPRAAGRFAAEALSGALAATERENAARKQKYQLDLQQSLLKHQEQIRQADAQAEIDAANAKTQNVYSAQQHGENLKAAFDQFNASKLKGEAGNLDLFAKGDQQAKALQLKAEQIGAQLKSAEADAKDKRDAAIRAGGAIASLAEHMESLQGRKDALAEKRANDAAIQADKAEQNKIRQANEARQEKHDQERDQIARSALAQKDKEIALRALEINYTHMDRQARESEQRGSVMHHETPEEISAKTDMMYLRSIAEAARKKAIGGTEADKADATVAQMQYNRARKNYQDIGEKARKADITTGKKLPGVQGKTYRFNAATGQVEEVK